MPKNDDTLNSLYKKFYVDRSHDLFFRDSIGYTLKDSLFWDEFSENEKQNLRATYLPLFYRIK